MATSGGGATTTEPQRPEAAGGGPDEHAASPIPSNGTRITTPGLIRHPPMLFTGPSSHSRPSKIWGAGRRRSAHAVPRRCRNRLPDGGGGPPVACRPDPDRRRSGDRPAAPRRASSPRSDSVDERRRRDTRRTGAREQHGVVHFGWVLSSRVQRARHGDVGYRQVLGAPAPRRTGAPDGGHRQRRVELLGHPA